MINTRKIANKLKTEKDELEKEYKNLSPLAKCLYNEAKININEKISVYKELTSSFSNYNSKRYTFNKKFKKWQNTQRKTRGYAVLISLISLMLGLIIFFNGSMDKYLLVFFPSVFISGIFVIIFKSNFSGVFFITKESSQI